MLHYALIFFIVAIGAAVAVVLGLVNRSPRV
jgi:uncharacterized membrane protein YtjA (UPF0391 family)